MRTLRIGCPIGRAVVTAIFVVSSASASSLGEDPCERLMSALHVLTEGSFDERWTLLDDDLPYLTKLADASNETLKACRPRAERVILGLLRREPDDRIVARLLDQIGSHIDGPFSPFFVEGLNHPSPNVRRRVAGALASAPLEASLPALRSLWARETRPWVRSTVALALGSAHDESVLDDLNALLGNDEPRLASAALYAVQQFRDSRSIPSLERLAASPESDLQVRATMLLASWRDMAGSDAALVRLALSAEDSVAVSAIEILTARGKENLGLLYSIHRNAVSEGRVEAINAASRGIEQVEQQDFSETVTFACGGVRADVRKLPLVVYFDGDDSGQGSRMVTPPDGDLTVRCWDGPGYANPAHVYPRLRSGDTVFTFEDFEWNDELWFVAATVHAACWVPARYLAADSADLEQDGIPGDGHMQPEPVEFDVMPEDLTSPARARALHYGFATLFDDDGEVTGVRLNLIAPDREQLLWILDTRDAADKEFAREIDTWLIGNTKSWIDDRELWTRIQDFDRSSEP